MAEPKEDEFGSVEIELIVTEAFSNSTCVVVVTADHPAVVRFPGTRIFGVSFGERVGADTVAVLADGSRHRAEVQLLGCFAHVPCAPDDELRHGQAPGTERAEYTVRFHPFISSWLRFRVDAGGSVVGALAVSVPPELRIVWARSALVDEDTGDRLARDEGHEPNGWKEALSFMQPRERSSRVYLEAPVISSGRYLTGRLLNPIFSWLGSLVVIFVASLIGDVSLTVGLVGGAWVFLLREWSGSERSHQLNFLSAVFLIEAVIAAVWAAASLVGTIPTIVVASVVVAGTVDLVRAAIPFEYRGRLPRRYEAIWAPITVWLERRRAKRRTSAGVSGFDSKVGPTSDAVAEQ